MAGQLSAFGFSAPDVIGEQIERYQNRQDAETAYERSRMSQMANFDFQTGMSNTAWQRAVEDMRLAGLNPMLAYHSGPASTPGGGSFTAPLAHASGGRTLSGSAGFHTAAQVERDEAVAGEARAVTSRIAVEERKLEQEIRVLLQEEGIKKEQIPSILQAREKLFQETRSALVDANVAEAFQFAHSAADLVVAQAAAKAARLEGEIDDTKYGEVLRYLRRLVQTIGGGLAAAVGGYLGGSAARVRRGGPGLRPGSGPGLRPPERWNREQERQYYREGGY